MYELLGGRNPFNADTAASAITAILNKVPQPLHELRPDLPDALHRLVDRCLQKDRELRPPDAASVQREMETIEHSGESWTPTRTIAAPAGPTTRRKRSMAGAVMAIVAIALAALALWVLRPGQKAVQPVSSGLLAVFPFSIRGSEDLAYLGEGMVDLVSNRLDGLGTTRTVAPRVVFARLQEDDLDPADPEEAAALASRLGAGRYVTGDLVMVGERVTLSIYLHDAEGTEEEPALATVEGVADEVLDLIDAAVVNLAVHSLSTPGDRLQRIGALTSHSLEATRAYL